MNRHSVWDKLIPGIKKTVCNLVDRRMGCDLKQISDVIELATLHRPSSSVNGFNLCFLFNIIILTK